jgi:ubiquinone/menaquinone biosynthesis C-methylase UbiE
MLARKIYYALNPKQRFWARRLVYLPVDVYEKITGKRDALTPPKGMIFIGPGDFKKIGAELVENFKELGELQPHHRVLDIGSGIGRIAIPLTQYLSNEGSYEGFDVVKMGVDWCQKKITPKYSNFKFQHIPLRNDLYNLDAKEGASDIQFPYDNEEFDFIVLTSVFTHMQQKEVENYLKEISRVLKPTGTCFATFFIIDEASEKHLQETKEPFFTYKYDTYYLHDDKVKDANIAYKIDFIEDTLAKNSLCLAKRHNGWWAGGDKNQHYNFQDICIIKKLND